MLFVSVRVDQQVVYVDQYIGDVPQNSISSWKLAGQPKSPMGEVIQ